MSVITARDVEKAKGVLVVAKGDILTPLARDRAKELGIRIASSADATETGRGIVGLPSVVKPAIAPNGQPRSGALYRRGAYEYGRQMLAASGTTGRKQTARPRVAVVGAGHVGAVTAMRLAESDLFDDVRMIDVVDGLAAGLALDISHGAALRTFTTQVTGSAEMAAVADADIVVVTAGRPRTPGMTRTDLTVANAAIVRGIAETIRTSAPNAVVVVVTNPLEEMTELMARLTGFPQERVIGMGGVLDTARFKALVGGTGRVRPEDVDAIVIGSHGAEMVVPLSQAKANGKPLDSVVPRTELDDIVRRTRESGAEVTSLLKSGSAFISPGSAIARQVEAIVRASDDVVPACVRSGGAYGLADTRVGLPVRLGPSGVREIVVLALSDAERRELRASADAIRARIRALD